MSQIYEVVIFTAAMQDYADWVLDQLILKSLLVTDYIGNMRPEQDQYS
jgi:TFIIF-interacting CTD phosphatase-like protein